MFKKNKKPITTTTTAKNKWTATNVGKSLLLTAKKYYRRTLSNCPLKPYIIDTNNLCVHLSSFWICVHLFMFGALCTGNKIEKLETVSLRAKLWLIIFVPFRHYDCVSVHTELASWVAGSTDQLWTCTVWFQPNTEYCYFASSHPWYCELPVHHHLHMEIQNKSWQCLTPTWWVMCAP